MDRGSLSKVEDIKSLTKDLDDAGYYSLLLTYHSNNRDFLTKSLLAADNTIKLKFMIAMRTYAISPEYMAMVCKSYNEEFPNKLILNVVSGDLHSDENSVNNIVMFGDQLSTPESRLPYTKEWIEKFLAISAKWYTPEILMGGHSEKTREMCNLFDFTHISALNMYLEYVKKQDRIINKKQMVWVTALVRETEQEAKDFLSNNNMLGAEQWTILGTHDYVKNKLQDLQNLGVTDIIIAQLDNDTESYRIHNIVRELALK
jgi:alkanesulfonate monooxygenase SsuD/methylene tetrahydromethanopterin reductase-like flavin-dependent oxidoreductase (luciferase family)